MRWSEYQRSADSDPTHEAIYASGGSATSWLSHRRIGELRRGELPTLLWLIPAALAVAYVALFLFHLSRNVAELTWDPDYSSGFTLPETLVHTGSSGNTVISSSGQWISLWFGLLTATLPFHRPLWSIAPTLLLLATALTVGWSVSRVADRRAATLAVLLSLIISPLALAFLMAPVAHNSVYLGTALIGAYIVWLARGEGRRRWISWLVPPVAGVALGACLASDLLIEATAILPLAVTAVLAGVQRDRRSRLLAVCALTTAAVAFPVASFTTSTMHSQGYLTLPTPKHVVPLAELPERAELLFKGLKALFNGYLGGPTAPGGLNSAVGVLSTVVMSGALLALLAFAASAAARLLWAAARRRGPQTAREPARSLHVLYWGSSAAAACGVFWIAGETGGGTNLHESYYGTVIFSVAAVIPLLLSGGALSRWLIPVGISVLFLASLVGLAGNYMDLTSGIARESASLVKIARANHATTGYGGYDTSSFTWNTHGRVTVRPLLECENPNGPGICPFYLMSTPTWYVPRERHTFLLTVNGELWLHALPTGLGKPLATYRLGEMSMYIYPYDIASRLGPQQD